MSAAITFVVGVVVGERGQACGGDEADLQKRKESEGVGRSRKESEGVGRSRKGSEGVGRSRKESEGVGKSRKESEGVGGSRTRRSSQFSQKARRLCRLGHLRLERAAVDGGQVGVVGLVPVNERGDEVRRCE